MGWDLPFLGSGCAGVEGAGVGVVEWTVGAAGSAVGTAGTFVVTVAEPVADAVGGGVGVVDGRGGVVVAGWDIVVVRGVVMTGVMPLVEVVGEDELDTGVCVAFDVEFEAGGDAELGVEDGVEGAGVETGTVVVAAATDAAAPVAVAP
jgi:hypothetical protein